MRALALPLAIRSGSLAAAALTGVLVSVAADSGANIGLALLLPAAAAVWGGVDGLRSVRTGRPDREGLLVWLLSGAAFGVLAVVGSGLGAVVAPGAVTLPVGALLGEWALLATGIAVPGAVAFGLARGAAEASARRAAR